MKTKKFTVIDGVIVLGILAVALVLFSMLPNSLNKNTAKKVTIKAHASQVDNEVCEKFKAGETVALSYTDEYPATVVDFSSEPSKNYVENLENDEIIVSYDETKSDIYVTLETMAEVTDTYIKQGDMYFRVGSFLPVLCKDFAVNAYIIDVIE